MAGKVKQSVTEQRPPKTENTAITCGVKIATRHVEVTKAMVST